MSNEYKKSCWGSKMSERGEASDDEADEDPEEPEKSKDVKSSVNLCGGMLEDVPKNPPY
jgi:hypothetical protein